MQSSSSLPEFHPIASLNELEQSLAPKAEFIAALEHALTQRIGFAVAKMGVTEEKLLLLLQLRETNAPLTSQRVVASKLKIEAGHTAGIFPSTPEGLLAFTRVYRNTLRELDYLGLILERFESFKQATINYHQLTNRPIRFRDLHPDRSIPDNRANCYLPLLKGKRILIVNPFAKLLAERATREIFQGVWQASGKKFFEPASVVGLEFPYGFARETWAHYASSLELMQEIRSRMETFDFDVALVAAGGMGVPLTVHAKHMGKVGIMLGGHLQVLFGVKGARWKDKPLWRDTFFNEWWIDMPEEYKPKPGDNAGESAYW